LKNVFDLLERKILLVKLDLDGSRLAVFAVVVDLDGSRLAVFAVVVGVTPKEILVKPREIHIN